jgi:hypothetical protein
MKRILDATVLKEGSWQARPHAKIYQNDSIFMEGDENLELTALVKRPGIS